jgi:L-ascorbate metabolism protein UlaG (beta-lactamase superfamily)
MPFVTSLGVGAHLESWGVPGERIVELDWWESYTLPHAELTITATPSQHFSGRTPRTRNSTLWSSLIIRSPRHTVFFSGDTGLTTEYQAIRERFGPFDLVMLEIGAFHPAWGDMHLGPENALKAHALLGGGAFLPIHWGTFALGMHAWDQPAEVLLQLAPHAGAQLVMPRLGQAVEPARAEPVEPWWRAAAEGRRPRGLGGVVGSTLPKTLPWPMD